MMNYTETLAYLFTNLPMFSRTGAAAYKKDITNTMLLCKAIGNPQEKIKTIHIAGTNGKGSVSHILAAVFQQCGYKTGLYTSPHLKDFRERIKINGEMIPEDFVVSFVKKILPVSEEIKPSFFELTVAMMLDWFASEHVDIAIIETGLGGRLDSTNIIIPELSIITNIGYDHMNILGNTLAEIAFEKAGIIKKNITVVIGETLPETKPVFVIAATNNNSPIIFAEEKFSIDAYQLSVDKLTVTLMNNYNRQSAIYTLDLNGIYQKNNLRTAITSLEVLADKGYSFDLNKITEALSQVKKINGLHGRWDVLHQHPLVVLDVAHNEDGIKQLLQQLSLFTFSKINIVFGVVKDKEIDTILSLFPKEAVYYFTKAQIPRALPADDLAARAKKHSLNGTSYPNVNIALMASLDNACKEDLILICGSVYLVGEVDENIVKEKLG